MRPLRNNDPSLYRLITCRTREARLWLHPSRNVEKLLGGILARYTELLSIDLYAYCFLGNHYHLLLRAPERNTDEFCENLNREIARRINWKFHREGSLWYRRYDDQEVLCEDDVLRAYLYVTTNPVRHGLVDHPGKWGGLNSYAQSLSEKTRSFTFYCYSEEEEEKRVCRHSIKLSVLPQLKELKKETRQAELSRLIEERTKEYQQERKERGEGFIGMERILAEVPGGLPQQVSRSPRPVAYTRDVTLLREARKRKREREASYREASARYRLGELAVEFPEYSFKPPLHRKPRLERFVLLPEDYFKEQI